MSDSLSLERLNKLALEVCCEIKISDVCKLAFHVASRERMSDAQTEQFLLYISEDMGLRFDDQMLEVCREEAAEERAYLYGNELQ